MIKVFNRKPGFIILSVILCGIVLIYIYDNPSTSGEEINYESYEEARIKNLVETLEGISDVTVLLTYENSNEVQSSINLNDEKDYIKLKGIAISARGAENPLLAEKIKSLLCAAYNINSKMIYVCGK